ncbi:uncharacterized protein EHS24_003054 [Apiotrichum porosum]|uniref:Uncharacterized protein n=1 Tax=Apiotrichum porosum TaxID=105984 RepID=A0A427XF11_9TREE|nr:uncharacterized protein EHS24_003054 [Apiotrichum porosum]RSH77501.1 hypothetical protein EHS24_003054 [Apiotrichum porosum]
MISLGIGFFAINAASLVFIRRRIPLAPAVSHRRPKIAWSHLRSWVFACGFTTLLLSSMGNFTPTLWIPTFADNVGATKPGGVALVSIMNGKSTTFPVID